MGGGGGHSVVRGSRLYDAGHRRNPKTGPAYRPPCGKSGADRDSCLSLVIDSPSQRRVAGKHTSSVRLGRRSAFRGFVGVLDEDSGTPDDVKTDSVHACGMKRGAEWLALPFHYGAYGRSCVAGFERRKFLGKHGFARRELGDNRIETLSARGDPRSTLHSRGTSSPDSRRDRNQAA